VNVREVWEYRECIGYMFKGVNYTSVIVSDKPFLF